MTCASVASGLKYTLTSTLTFRFTSVELSAAPIITRDAMTKSVIVMMKTAERDTNPFRMKPVKP